jgi:hypothetical protein
MRVGLVRAGLVHPRPETGRSRPLNFGCRSVADPVLFVGLLFLAGRGEKGQRQARGSILIASRSISISSPAKSAGLAL